MPRLQRVGERLLSRHSRSAITEYNWGAESHINGATTQADVLGIFGREGLDRRRVWTTPATTTPTFKAIKMYRNYDGAKSSFGDVSVKATVPNPDNLAAFAAQRASDGTVTVMAINKVTTSTLVNLSLANFTAGATAQAWQLTSANAIQRLADVGVTGGTISTTLPAQSITLFVVPGSTSSTPSLSIGDVSVNEGNVGQRERHLHRRPLGGVRARRSPSTTPPRTARPRRARTTRPPRGPSPSPRARRARP